MELFTREQRHNQYVKTLSHGSLNGSYDRHSSLSFPPTPQVSNLLSPNP